MGIARMGSGLIAAALMLVVGVGCQNKMHDENLALHEQNRELQARLGQQDANAAQMNQLQSENAQLQSQIAQLQSQLRTPTTGAGAQPGIEGIETSYDATKGEMTVNVPGDVLFDAGQATLKDSAKATLNKIAGAIKRDHPGKMIRVEGHSDTDPINKTKGKWRDNLELSNARATEVTRYLMSQGIPAKQIAPTGFGDTRPKATKAASRRVEIVVVTG